MASAIGKQTENLYRICITYSPHTWDECESSHFCGSLRQLIACIRLFSWNVCGWVLTVTNSLKSSAVPSRKSDLAIRFYPEAIHCDAGVRHRWKRLFFASMRDRGIRSANAHGTPDSVRVASHYSAGMGEAAYSPITMNARNGRVEMFRIPHSAAPLHEEPFHQLRLRKGPFPAVVVHT